MRSTLGILAVHGAEDVNSFQFKGVLALFWWQVQTLERKNDHHESIIKELPMKRQSTNLRKSIVAVLLIASSLCSYAQETEPVEFFGCNGSGAWTSSAAGVQMPSIDYEWDPQACLFVYVGSRDGLEQLEEESSGS